MVDCKEDGRLQNAGSLHVNVWLSSLYALHEQCLYLGLVLIQLQAQRGHVSTAVQDNSEVCGGGSACVLTGCYVEYLYDRPSMEGPDLVAINYR